MSEMDYSLEAENHELLETIEKLRARASDREQLLDMVREQVATRNEKIAALENRVKHPFLSRVDTDHLLFAIVAGLAVILVGGCIMAAVIGGITAPQNHSTDITIHCPQGSPCPGLTTP